MHLASIDTSLNKTWHKNIKFSKTEAQVKLLSQELTKSGEAYLLYKIYEDKVKEKKDKKPAYDIELLYVKNDTAEVKKIKLNIENSFIKSANLKLRENGELYIVGLYSNTSNGPTHGVFYIKSIDGEIKLSTKQKFLDTEIEKMGDKNTEKDKSGEEGLNDEFSFNNMQILADGSTFVTVEPNGEIVTMSTDVQGRMRQTTTYFSDEIIIINITPEGEIAKLNILPKLQRSAEYFKFISHASFVYNDKIYLFYNEDEDNFKIPIGEKPKLTQKYSDFVATMTTLDKNGTFDRKALLEYDDTGSILIPSEIRKLSETKYFFSSVQRKLFTSRSKYTFGTISIVPE